MSTLKIRAEGARKASDRLGRMRRNLNRLELRAPETMAKAAVPSFKQAAPSRSGRLKRGIHATIDGEVISDARAIQGYSYTGVTRFGHKPGSGPDPDRIYPKGDRFAASVIANRGQRATGGKAALAFSIGGRLIFRKSVRRYHPKSDWADEGLRLAQPVVRARFVTVVRRAVH